MRTSLDSLRRHALAVAALAVLAACSSGGGMGSPPDTAGITDASTDVSPTGNPTDSALQVLIDGAARLHRFSLGTDRLGVWICRVPIGVRDPLYNPVDFRLNIDAETAVDLLNTHVRPFFDAVSDSRYDPQFEIGGEVSITVNETSKDCVDHARAQAADRVTGVVVIADAEHAETQHGGWGTPGDACPAPDSCPARVTGRAVYIGASDFHPDWGDVPAVDLIEHEIGHSLGFPHSGLGNGYTSAIDLMSNSAAPRDVDEDRRNAPDTIAINRVAAGWIPLSDVVVVIGSGTHRIVPSTDPDGLRVLVLPIDADRFLTVEVLTNADLNDHLPQSGVVMHEIDQSPTACGRGAGRPCLNEYRKQWPVTGTAPYTDLLGAGSTWTGEDWAITSIVVTDDGWDITVTRSS